MQNDLGIRLGTPEDEEPMLDLAMRAWQENGIQGVNPEKLRGMIKPALYLWDGLVGIIGEPGEKIEGAVLLRVTQQWYSDDRILEEKAIFVDPQYRGAKIGRAAKLCEFSKLAAKKLELPLLIGVLSNHRAAGKIRLYQRKFGDPAGVFFLYNGQTGHENVTEH